MTHNCFLFSVLASVILPYSANADWTAVNDQGQTGNPNDTAYTIPSLGGSSGPLQRLVPANYGNLKLDSTQVDQTQVILQFTARAEKTYGVLANSGLGSTWTKLADVPPQSTSRVVTISDSLNSSGAGRFYKLTTPSLP